MATLAQPAPTHGVAAASVGPLHGPRASGFEIIVPLGALYVVLLVLGPFLAMAFHH